MEDGDENNAGDNPPAENKPVGDSGDESRQDAGRAPGSGEAAEGSDTNSDGVTQRNRSTNSDSATKSDQATSESGARSLASFLYTQNPFYLISCLLIIYGCQSLAISQGDALVKATSMTGGIAAYALVMAVVCVTVVRLCKVWQDARSIFLVVLISLVAMTTGFDELCIGDQSAAAAFAGACGVLTVASIEFLRRFCRLRLGWWYSISLYAYFAVSLVFPLWLGNAVAKRQDALANWGAVLFSLAISAALLLLAPAMRRGGDYVKENGTPWTWPLYPLAAFVVLVVLAGIRSHAIWMSFGFFGAAGEFEPFLLLPMVAAILILTAETGLGQRLAMLQRFAVFLAPTILLCGLSNDSMTWLPIRRDLVVMFGSALTASLLVLLGLYAWMAFRRIRYADLGIPAVLFAASGVAELPEICVTYGVHSWMIAALGCVALLVITIRRIDNDLLWTAFAGATAFSMALAGEAYDQRVAGIVVGSLFAITSMLVIGAVFKTDLAEILRHIAALALLVIGCVCGARLLAGYPEWVFIVVTAGVVVSCLYAFVVLRSGWFYVAGFQAVLLVLMIGFSSRQSNHWRQINWPIASGVVCLGVGLAITSSKAGVYQRLAQVRTSRQRFSRSDPPRFQPGL